MMIKNTLKLILFLFVFSFPYQLSAQGLITSKSGTYYRFGNDIKRVCSYIPLKVYESRGSSENIDKLLNDEAVQFAIIQQDSLLQYKKSHSNYDSIMMVFPLYLEEMHLLARKSLGARDIKDLSGARVNIGEVESGSYITAKGVDEALDLNWKTKTYPQKQSLLKLLDGEIDAMFYVIGSPWKKLDSLGAEAKIFYDLIPIHEKELLSQYTMTQLKYFNQKVDTLGVYSVLVTNKDVPGIQVKSLIQCIQKNLINLYRFGHSKWKQVRIENFVDIKIALHPELKAYLRIEETKEKIRNKIKL